MNVLWKKTNESPFIETFFVDYSLFTPCAFPTLAERSSKTKVIRSISHFHTLHKTQDTSMCTEGAQKSKNAMIWEIGGEQNQGNTWTLCFHPLIRIFLNTLKPGVTREKFQQSLTFAFWTISGRLSGLILGEFSMWSRKREQWAWNHQHDNQYRGAILHC